MSRLDYQSARYRVAFAYGLRVASGGPDRQLVTAFEEFLRRLLLVVGPIELVQKGLAYFENLRIEALRQVKRKKGRDLTSFDDATKNAQQTGLYVFDALNASTPPAVFANVHWSRCSRIGSIVLAPVAGREVGRFVCVAVEESRLSNDAVAVFDSEFARLYKAIAGIKGGVLQNRPYVWNGSAGLEWMFYEVTQSVQGDIAQWVPMAELKTF